MGYQDIYALQKISGMKAKQEFMAAHREDTWFKTFLYYCENPMVTYNLSEKTLRKAVENYKEMGQNICPEKFETIFTMCAYLSSLRGMDMATLLSVQYFLCEECNEEERELYIKLLSKKLRLGVTAKTINKVFGDLIPEWEVQQAFPFEKYPIKPGTDFWLTQKLNGVRATYYNGQLISRGGQPYTGLEHILKELRYASSVGLVLDGELTLKDKGDLSDNEAFRKATGIINSDAENKTEICYTVFDAIIVDDFESSTSKVPYTYRRLVMDRLDKEHFSHCEYVNVLPVLYHGRDQKHIWTLLDQMVAEDKEGLMLNTDVPYKRARHNGILKVKRFYTMDLPIVGYVEGEGKIAGSLGSLIVSYNGNEVNVGSGYTYEQREELWAMRDDLPGMLCEVKYKEISYDQKTGAESLQFPIFITLRTDKTEESHG